MIVRMIDTACRHITYGYSEALPAAVPISRSWYRGVDVCYGDLPAATYSYVGAFLQVVPQYVNVSRYLPPPPPPRPFLAWWNPWWPFATRWSPPIVPLPAVTRAQARNLKTYVRLKIGGTWVKVQDQATVGMTGAHWIADLSAMASLVFRYDRCIDGSVVFETAPSGFCTELLGGGRGVFTPGTIDAVYAQVDAKTTSNSNVSLIARVGADWWTGRYGGSKRRVGGSNWIRLTPSWQTIYFSSLTPAALRLNPPPPLA